MVGVAAQVAFTGGWVVAETWQGPAYSPLSSTISDLQAANAPHVWFPVLCFAVGGLGTFAFAAFGLRPALAAAGRTAAYAPWVLAIAGLAIGNSFPLIPCQTAHPGCSASAQLNSPGGITDAVVSTLAFLALALLPFPLWRRLRLLSEWRRVKPVMVAARILGPAGFVLLYVASVTELAEGLMERALAVICGLWIAALAATLIGNALRSRRGGTDPRSLQAGL